jgi:hypothetical protein
MKRRILFLLFCLALLTAKPAAADNRFIVRTSSSLGQQLLSTVCLLQGCTVVGAIDGTLNQVFLLTAPSTVDPTALLNVLNGTLGIVNAELDQVISLVGGQNQLTTVPGGLSDSTPVQYYGATVWDGYANQPAAQKVRAAEAQNTFQVSGTGIVADIDTGVDPTHPALQAVLLPGYDFTRNQANGSEMTDFTQPPPSGNPPAPAKVNQSTAAVLDQSTAAVLDGNTQYAAFGHGTMVMGVIHLVAPHAQLLPLKAFKADGSAFLSDILRAVYYAAQNNANVINMSFDLKINSQEFASALSYVGPLKIICVASAGNDGAQETVYPAAYTSDVMGVASTDLSDQRSSFSNFGPIVWVAAPGEQIVTTYPFSTYAAGSGTSFSAPFVSGTSALFHELQPGGAQTDAAQAIAHAQPIGAGMGNGRLDIVQALQSVHPTNTTPDFTAAASPSSQTVTAGDTASFTVSVSPSGGFNSTVTWTCTGAPTAATCTVSPASMTLDGSTNANATVTITTTARTSAFMFLPPQLPSPPLSRVRDVGFLCVAALCLLWNFRRARSTSTRLVGLSVLLLATLSVSCGGGSTMTPPPPPPPQGTPAGSYVIKLTATSQSVTHTTQVSLTVK